MKKCKQKQKNEPKKTQSGSREMTKNHEKWRKMTKNWKI